MSSSASTDTFPADVAATRRASGITIAPEAALHRALQERTDELERVREAAASVERTMQKHIYTLTRERDEARASLAEAQVDPLMRTLQQVRRERDEARAELERERESSRNEALTLRRMLNDARDALDDARQMAAEPADLGSACAGGCMLTRRWRPGVPMLPMLDDDDDSTISVTATDPEDAARRVHEYVSAHAPPTAPDVLTPTEARAVEAVRERDRLDAAIRDLAVTINEHDDSADLFDSEEEELASVRAVVEEFLRAHGHPVADERATRRFAPPTAPDVGSTTSAPAAGAADPRRGRTPDEIRAWAAGLFGGKP